MQHRGISALVGAFLLLAVARMASAQEPWERAPLEAEPKDILASAGAVKTEPGTAVVFLLDELRVSFDAEGRSEWRHRQVYRVLTEEGARENDVFQIEWAPWYQERPVVRARVITPDGQGRPLNLETLSEKPVAAGSPDVYTDRKSLVGPLPAVVAGAVIEIETLIRHRKPFFDRGVLTYQFVDGSVPVQRSRIILDAPEGMALRHVARLLPKLIPREETAAGRRTITFEAGPFAPREAVEPFMPYEVPRWPYIAFTTGASWGEIARGYHDIVEAQIANADLAALGELPPKDRPEIERIGAILALLHSRVRYTSLALGDASIVPRPPAETLMRGYGDCKDKSALLVAALRKCGIEAHVAVLLTGPGIDIESDLPGFGVFNHAIVHVDGTPGLWIDPTDKSAKPGTLPVQDQDRLALIAAPGTQALLRTPAPVPADNFDLRIREFTLADYGRAKVVEVIRPTGASERRLRQTLDADKKSVDQALQGYASRLFGSPKISSSTYSGPTDVMKPFELRLEMDETSRAATDLREAVVGVTVANLFADLPAFLLQADDEEDKDKEKPWRKHDVVLYQPYVMEWRYHIIPPPGFECRTFPTSGKDTLGPATLLRDYSRQNDGSITAIFRFDCGKRRYTPQEAMELRKGIQRHQAAGTVVLGFNQIGTVHLEAGRIKEAISEYRRLTDAYPKKGIYRAEIARALMAGGLGEAARAEARKATEIEPGSQISLETLAWTFQHDLIGRRYEKGWDPKGAEEAYRAALKLKPGSLEDTLELAILKEYDLEGQRYSPRAHLGEAIDLYKSVLKQIEGTNFEINLNFALLWSGRFGELSGRVVKSTDPTGRAMYLITKAAQEGAPAALAWAARSIPEEAARRQCLSDAGEYLVKLRYYPEAASVLAASARGSANAANVLGRADRLRKCRKWNEPPADGAEPGGRIKTFFYLATAPETRIEELGKLMSRYVVDTTKPDAAKEFEAMRNSITETLRRQGLSLDVGRDLILSFLEPAVEGEAETGCRVRVNPVFGSQTPQLWYLHPEEGTLRILSSLGSDLGRLALDLIEAGETEKARAWLKWAADEIGEGAERDPLEAPPFALLWKKAKDDPKLLRVAAAALGTQGGRCEAALQVLEEARRDEVLDARQKYVLDHAIANGYRGLGRYEEAGAAAARMASAEPDSDAAFNLRTLALEKLRKWDDLRAVSEARLRSKPDSPFLLHWMMHVEMVQGRHAATQEYGRKLVKMGQANYSVLNSLAWSALLEGKATEAALDDAQKSVLQSQGKSEYALHTLATVYADLGRPVEARDVLLQTFQSRSSAEPEPHDWYVLGRIAEEYGAREAAIAAYHRTGKAENADLPDSTNQLALRRLKVLGEK